jgi:hypothetical protein
MPPDRTRATCKPKESPTDEYADFAICWENIYQLCSKERIVILFKGRRLHRIAKIFYSVTKLGIGAACRSVAHFSLDTRTRRVRPTVARASVSALHQYGGRGRDRLRGGTWQEVRFA